VRKALALVGDMLRSQGNAVLFSVGFSVALVSAAATWSWPIAGIAAGWILMLVAVYPYLRKP
jgi:uncharacterized membrane protein